MLVESLAEATSDQMSRAMRKARMTKALSSRASAKQTALLMSLRLRGSHSFTALPRIGTAWYFASQTHCCTRHAFPTCCGRAQYHTPTTCTSRTEVPIAISAGSLVMSSSTTNACECRSFVCGGATRGSFYPRVKFLVKQTGAD